MNTINNANSCIIYLDDNETDTESCYSDSGEENTSEEVCFDPVMEKQMKDLCTQASLEWEELGTDPNTFRTTLCRNGSKAECAETRKVCTFAHSIEEVRVPLWKQEDAMRNECYKMHEEWLQNQAVHHQRMMYEHQQQQHQRMMYEHQQQQQQRMMYEQQMEQQRMHCKVQQYLISQEKQKNYPTLAQSMRY
jgi:hypothetical protein